jgi:hypothetical protein
MSLPQRAAGVLPVRAGFHAGEGGGRKHYADWVQGFRGLAEVNYR